jgi:hypothetical protein
MFISIDKSIKTIGLIALSYTYTLVCSAQNDFNNTICPQSSTQYRIKEIRTNLSELLFFQSETDTIQIGPVIKSTDIKSGMNIISLKRGDKNFLITLQQRLEFFSITTTDHKLLATYVDAPFTDTSYGQLGFEKYSDYAMRNVSLNVKNKLKKKNTIQFMTADNKVILTGNLIKKDDLFILCQNGQDEIDSQLLDISAMVILWMHAFVEVTKSK